MGICGGITSADATDAADSSDSRRGGTLAASGD